ncbi:unnamed protein product, partial [Linum tenue]
WGIGGAVFSICYFRVRSIDLFFGLQRFYIKREEPSVQLIRRIWGVLCRYVSVTQ